MKKTKKTSMSTDYFFEELYKKLKTFYNSNLASKIASMKVLAIVHWFKDIN
jgi:hypothetical protein